MLNKTLLTLLFCIFTLGSHAATPLPMHDPVPGGVAIVELGNTPINKVTYYKKRVMVLHQDNQYVAVVGIPLTAKAGIEHLRVTELNGRTWRKEFSITGKDYETRHITIKNKRKVSPNPEDLQRHAKEKPLMVAAMKTWTEQDEVPTRFALPVDGPLSSPFGLKRIYNKQARIRRHTGLDIAAPVGTPITAPAAGKVIRTGDYFFTGGTVFIDHGQGLVTLYCHMDSIEVKAGDLLQTGQRMGTVGMTGRVSGPHLHWVVVLNNVKVEPKLFLAPTN